MHAFDLLGDPVRRRILELLAGGELAAGVLGAVVRDEFGISQPAVSQHLKVLRENGFARVRSDGTRRLYAAEPESLREADHWLDRLRAGPRPLGVGGGVRGADVVGGDGGGGDGADLVGGDGDGGGARGGGAGGGGGSG